jgi:uncharacterized protein (TIGR02246 family)
MTQKPDAAAIQAEDERALRALAARLEAAWNAGDAGAWAANMTEDVYMTNILGDRYNGREILESGHRHIFATIYKDSRITITVELIRFVRPDVALMHLNQLLLSRLTASGIASTARQRLMTDEMHESLARTTLMVVKHQGTWQILSLQNTIVASPKGTS